MICTLHKDTKIKFLSLLTLLVFSGCQLEKNNEKPLVLATTGIIGDCMKEILGNQAEVLSLMGAGVDPHYFKPSHGDMRLLGNARMVIHNGNRLEGKMSSIFEKLKKYKTVLAVSDGIPSNKMRSLNKNETILDPHIWLDPLLWVEGLDSMVIQLGKTDFNTDLIRQNWERYRKEILEVHHQYLKRFSQVIPEDQRILITSHDAFFYFGKTYGFSVKGLQGISTAAEFSIRDLTNLVDFIVENNVKAIFIENSVPPKNLLKVIEACKRKGHVVKMGGELYSDALGDKNSKADTYIKMLLYNFETILEALK